MSEVGMLNDLAARQRTMERTDRSVFQLRTAAAFLSLPGLRGFWPMSAFGATGQAFDQSGNARTLTYNGNPTYNADRLVPYIDMDGTGDYLSRADEAGLDILGTETYIAAGIRGLTLGGWFYPTLNTAGLMTKGTGAAAASAYEMFVQAPTTLGFRVSTGAAYITVANTPLVANTWQFLAGRYTPSTEIKTWINQNTATNLVAVPAALPNVGAQFDIGAFGVNILPYTGRASYCFLCAAALSDTAMTAIFQQTRSAFRV